MEYLVWVWVGIIVLSLIIEAITWDMTSIWFAAGGLVALILYACGLSYLWQIIPFVVVSALCIIFLKPLVKKRLSKKTIPTNVSSFIGQKAKLIEETSEFKNGSLKLNGIIWTAQSSNKAISIEKDTEVEIVDVQGNTLKVKPVANKETNKNKTKNKKEN